MYSLYVSVYEFAKNHIYNGIRWNLIFMKGPHLAEHCWAFISSIAFLRELHAECITRMQEVYCQKEEWVLKKK